MVRRSSILAVLFVFAAGCGVNWQARVINQASFDHKCPRERVVVLGESGDPMSRAVDLDVCGKERRYRDLTSSLAFVDITDGIPSVLKPPVR